LHNKDKGDSENSPNIDTKNKEIEKETTGQELYLVSIGNLFCFYIKI